MPIFDKVFLFVETGGVVLIPLIILAFFMALLIAENFLYVFFINEPETRDYKNSLISHKIKTSNYKKRNEINKYLAAKARENYYRKNVNVINQFVVIAPLLGLLGTVTGMIEVFEVIKIHGSENTVLIGRGFSHATIPTMFGLTVAIFGFLSLVVLENAIKKMRLNNWH